MFLTKLDYQEREAFICLAVRAFDADAMISDEAGERIEACGREMGMTSFDDDQMMTLKEAAKFFGHSIPPHKKIVLLELIKLMHYNGGYDANAKKIIGALAKHFEITEAQVKEMEEAVVKYESLYQDMEGLIG